MRWILFVMMAFVFCGATGCQSQEERMYWINLVQDLREENDAISTELEKSKAIKAEISADIAAGTIDPAKGMMLLAKVAENIEGYKDIYDRNEGKIREAGVKLQDQTGKERWETIGTIAASVIASILGIRLQRGPSSRKFKNADGSIGSG